MRTVGEGTFALGLLLAGFAGAAGGALEICAFLLLVALLFVAALLVNLPALVLEVFAGAPAFLVEALVEAAFGEEIGLPAAGFLSGAGFEARLAAVDLATVTPAFAGLALSAAPLVETGAFVF